MAKKDQRHNQWPTGRGRNINERPNEPDAPLYRAPDRLEQARQDTARHGEQRRQQWLRVRRREDQLGLRDLGHQWQRPEDLVDIVGDQYLLLEPSEKALRELDELRRAGMR